jgi:hypothetical protein
MMDFGRSMQGNTLEGHDSWDLTLAERLRHLQHAEESGGGGGNESVMEEPEDTVSTAGDKCHPPLLKKQDPGLIVLR